MALLILDDLIYRISLARPIKMKWSFPDDANADRQLLEQLRKYEILNPNDIDHKNKAPIDLQQIISKFKNMTSTHASIKLKLFIIVRHGDGEHNAARRLYGTTKWRESTGYDMKYHDPPLTDKGIQQSKALQEHFRPIVQDIDLVLLSPLLRAIQTASHAVFPLLQTENKACDRTVLEYGRERINPYTCDSRSSLKHIQNIWNTHDFVYEGFGDDEDVKWSIHKRERREEMWMRANKLLHYVFERKENIVLYFGHGSFSESIMDVIRSLPAFHPQNTQYIPIVLREIKKQNGFV